MDFSGFRINAGNGVDELKSVIMGVFKEDATKSMEI